MLIPVCSGGQPYSGESTGVIGDSVLEFSREQGKNGWYFGYWDRAKDADGYYTQSSDFKKCMVIAIFKGSASNSRGLNIISTDEHEDTVYLRFDDMSYQTAGGLDGGRVPVTPYAFVVIPNSAKLVLIEENVQSLKEKPPVWNERARLKAE